MQSPGAQAARMQATSQRTLRQRPSAPPGWGCGCRALAKCAFPSPAKHAADSCPSRASPARIGALRMRPSRRIALAFTHRRHKPPLNRAPHPPGPATASRAALRTARRWPGPTARARAGSSPPVWASWRPCAAPTCPVHAKGPGATLPGCDPRWVRGVEGLRMGQQITTGRAKFVDSSPSP